MGNVASMGVGVAGAGIDAVAEGGYPDSMLKGFANKVANKATNNAVEVISTAGGLSPEQI